MSVHHPTRRRFLEAATAACAGALAVPARAQSPAECCTADDPKPPLSGELCLFTKALPDLDWARLARGARQVGFDGLDLTVRKGGHVLPERVEDDLPRAVDRARAVGVAVPMITTALTSAADPAAKAILRTAAGLGVRYFKAGYYLYESASVRDDIARAGHDFRTLVELAAEYGVQCGYHNHADYIGGALWDAARFVESLDPRWAGYYFDPRHAVAEGDAGAWKHAFRLIAPRLKMIAVKDFSWVKTATGWQDANCPLGEGMVDWTHVFTTLSAAGFSGPISLHLEYDVPFAAPSLRTEAVFAALARELAFLRARLGATRTEPGLP